MSVRTTYGATCMLKPLVLVFTGFLPLAAQAVDMVLHNAAVYTVDRNSTWAEAVAIEESRIVAVGSSVDVLKLAEDSTVSINLGGQMVLPGFHDSHIHLAFSGPTLLGCNLVDAQSLDAITEKLKSCATKDSDAWLVADNLNLSLFGPQGPTREFLDAASTTQPILVRANDGHSSSVNSKAIALAGIDQNYPDPAAGIIERDGEGNPTGTLRESAMEIIDDLIPELSPAQRHEALRASVEHANSLGITSAIDPWVGRDWINTYLELDKAGALTLKVQAALAYAHADLFTIDPPGVYESVLANRSEFVSNRFALTAVKLFIDGVLEGETAALVSPYLHRDDYHGELTFTQEELNRIVTDLESRDFQVHSHAIGDLAVRQILAAYGVARSAHGDKDLRHHITHLQLIHPDDHARFAELGVAANFQALWAMPDEWIMKLNMPVVGEDRVKRMYPINSILQTSATIVGGSDWSVSSANPLLAIEAAIVRTDPVGNDSENHSMGVLNASEAVDLAAMIRAYTANAAWSMHEESSVGSIEVGKQADLVVLDRNLFSIPAEDISRAGVVMTILDGEIIYRR